MTAITADWISPPISARVAEADAHAREMLVQVRATRVAEAEAQRARAAEAYDFGAEDRGFRRLTGAVDRDLSPVDQGRMQELAAKIWESNPLGQWLIEMTVDFILGEGATIETDDAALRAVIDRFWNDPVNLLEYRIDCFAREYCLFGELCLQAHVNDVDGYVRLGYIDPAEIDEVLTDPDNALIQTTVVLKSRDGRPGKRLKVIRAEETRAVREYGYLMPAASDEPYDGSCFLFQTNRLSNATRGRSDLLALIDWLDAYDAFLFDAMDGAQLFNTFIWDVELQGKTEEQIRAWMRENKTVKRGMIRAHNEKVTWKEVAPDLKALDKDAFVRTFRGHMIGSRSIPEHWYGLAGEVNFASAKEMGLPPVKRLSRRQKELRYVIATLVRFQVHQKIIRGLLPAQIIVTARVDQTGDSAAKTIPTDQAFTVVLPELSMKDQAGTVAAVNGLQAALERAEGRGWIRPQTAAKLFAHLVSQLGMEIKSDEEYTPGVPGGDATRDYQPGNQQRLLEMLNRIAKGNGDNVGQPKAEKNGAAA